MCEVKDGGENFSAGERQLIALTRALLSAHKIRVLLCDEATAHVDLETDKKIHDAVNLLSESIASLTSLIN